MSQKPWVHACVISFRRWQFSGVRNPEICLTGNSKKYCTKAFLDVTPEAAPLDFLDIIQHQLTLQTWKTWFCLPGFKRFRHLDFASVEKSFDPILSLISKIGCAWHSFSSRSGQLIRNIQHLRMFLDFKDWMCMPFLFKPIRPIDKEYPALENVPWFQRLDVHAIPFQADPANW